jgi:hypothetical protein
VPDEQSHFAYVQHIAELRTLPVCRMGTRTGVPPVIPAEYEKSLFFHRIIFKINRTHPFTDGRYGVDEDRFSFPPSQRKETIPMTDMESCWKILSHHYPPLYYLIGAAAYRSVYYGTFFTRFWTVRIVSILLALGILYACWRLARLLGKGGDDRGIRPWTAAALLGTFPMFSQVAVSISPNILETGIQTVFVFILLKMVEEGIPLRLTVPLSLIIAAGLLTRQHLIGLFPLGIGAVLLESRAHNAPAREIVRTVALMTGILVVVTGWWYLWFYVTHGRFDFATINFTAADASATRAPRRTLLDYLFCGQMFSFPSQSFWGSFAWRNINLPEAVVNLLSIAALGGMGMYAARLIPGSRAGSFDRRRSVWLLSVLIIYFVLIKAVGFSAFRYKGFEYLQGRHFFGMLGCGGYRRYLWVYRNSAGTVGRTDMYRCDPIHGGVEFVRSVRAYHSAVLSLNCRRYVQSVQGIQKEGGYQCDAVVSGKQPDRVTESCAGNSVTAIACQGCYGCCAKQQCGGYENGAGKKRKRYKESSCRDTEKNAVRYFRCGDLAKRQVQICRIGGAVFLFVRQVVHRLKGDEEQSDKTGSGTEASTEADASAP